MTWRKGTITDHPGGKQRDGVEITCDHPDCNQFELLGAHGGSVEKIQRLLVARGWEWTPVVDGGRDLCPEHASSADCTCVVSCADDPATACSLSGESHVHPNRHTGDVFGRCSIHPDAPGDH